MFKFYMIDKQCRP